MRKPLPAPVPSTPAPKAAKPAPVKPKPVAVKPVRGPLAPEQPHPTNNRGTGKEKKASLSPTPPLLGAGGRSKSAVTKSAVTKPAATKAPLPKGTKIIPVKASLPTPPAPVRVITETSGRSGRAWRLSSRYAIAYLSDAALAVELLAAEPRHLAKAAMAVYYDRKGKAFAWQVRFDAARWEEVVRRLG